MKTVFDAVWRIVEILASFVTIGCIFTLGASLVVGGGFQVGLLLGAIS